MKNMCKGVKSVIALCFITFEFMNSFDIYFYKPKENKQYHAKVDIAYQTSNLMRFKLTAGVREMLLEKHLYRKNNKWTVSHVNFNSLFGMQNQQKLLQNIFDAIDNHLLQK